MRIFVVSGTAGCSARFFCCNRVADECTQSRRRFHLVTLRSRANIDDPPALGEADAFPAFRHDRTPDAMLQAEARNFVGVRPQHVIALPARCHSVAVTSQVFAPADRIF